MNNTLTNVGAVLGRIFFAALFLMAGIGKIFGFSDSQAYMAKAGMPATAFFLVMAIIFLIAGGLSLLLGFEARVGALLLILFLVPASLIFHPPWVGEQMIPFMKNLALIGGLLLVMVHGAGPISFDAKKK